MKKLFTILLFTFVWNVQAQLSDFGTINFNKADNIANTLKGKELNNLPLLAYQLTYKLDTDVERFRAIYYWVCHNIENDYHLMLKNDRKRKKFKTNLTKLNHWNNTFKKDVFFKLLKQKRTLCSGYSYLIKELASLAGLECVIINGYGKTSASFKSLKMANHSWNAVKLGSKWYLCDATWSSGFVDEASMFIFSYNNSYFLMTPEKFAESHRPIEDYWFLEN